MRMHLIFSFLIGLLFLKGYIFPAGAAQQDAEDEQPNRTIFIRWNKGIDGVISSTPVLISEELSMVFERLSVFTEQHYGSLFDALEGSDHKRVSEILGIENERIEPYLAQRPHTAWLTFRDLLVGLAKRPLQDIRQLLDGPTKEVARHEYLRKMEASSHAIIERYKDAVEAYVNALHNIQARRLEAYKRMYAAFNLYCQDFTSLVVYEEMSGMWSRIEQDKCQDAQSIEKARDMISTFAGMAETYGYQEEFNHNDVFFRRVEGVFLQLWATIDQGMESIIAYVRKRHTTKENVNESDLISLQEINREICAIGEPLKIDFQHHMQELIKIREQEQAIRQEAVEIYVRENFFQAFFDVEETDDESSNSVVRHIMQVYNQRRVHAAVAKGATFEAQLKAAQDTIRELEEKRRQEQIAFREEAERNKKIQQYLDTEEKKREEERRRKDEKTQKREQDLKIQLDKVRAELEKIKRELGLKEKDVKTAQSKKEELEAALKKQREQAKEDLKRKQEEFERDLQRKIQAIQAELVQYKERFRKKEEEFLRLTESRKSAFAEVQSLKAELAEKKELTQQVEQLKAELEKLKQASKAESEAAEERSKVLQRENQEQSSKILGLKAAIDALRVQLSQAHAQLSQQPVPVVYYPSYPVAYGGHPYPSNGSSGHSRGRGRR